MPCHSLDRNVKAVNFLEVKITHPIIIARLTMGILSLLSNFTFMVVESNSIF